MAHDRAIVLDAPGLIALCRLGLLDEARRVAGALLVPDAVYAEATTGDRPGAREVVAARAHGGLTILGPVDSPELGLGRGETETIVHARSLGHPALLDDLLARRIGRRLGIVVLGTLALLVRLCQLGRVRDIEPLLQTLDDIGFRSTPELKAWARDAARHR